MTRGSVWEGRDSSSHIVLSLFFRCSFVVLSLFFRCFSVGFCHCSAFGIPPPPSAVPLPLGQGRRYRLFNGGKENEGLQHFHLIRVLLRKTHLPHKGKAEIGNDFLKGSVERKRFWYRWKIKNNQMCWHSRQMPTNPCRKNFNLCCPKISETGLISENPFR